MPVALFSDFIDKIIAQSSSFGETTGMCGAIRCVGGFCCYYGAIE